MRRQLLFVLVLGLLVRALLLVAVSDVGIHTDDERDYVTLAASILDGRGFAFDTGPTSIRPPLYPALIAGVWSVAPGRTYQSVRAVQILLSLVSVVLVYRLAWRLFGNRVALWTAATWALYPSFLYAGVLLLTEALFTTLVLAACVCAAEAVRSRERTVWFAIACGICVGLAALTRSVLWPYPVFLAPLVAFLSSGRWHQRAAAGAALFAAYVAVVAPWATRNTRLQKTFIVVDTMGGMNLRMGNFEHTIEDRMWDGVSLRGEQSWSHQMIVEHPEARRWTEGERDRWARQRATEYIRTHPGTTLRRSVRKFADFWGLEREYIAALQKGTYPLPSWAKALSASAVLASYVVIAMLACFGLFHTRWPEWRPHAPGLLTIAWICGIHAVVFGHSRYHLPLMPLIVMYAAAAVANRAWKPDRSRGYAAALGALAALVLAWGFEVTVRDAERIRNALS